VLEMKRLSFFEAFIGINIIVFGLIIGAGIIAGVIKFLISFNIYAGLFVIIEIFILLAFVAIRTIQGIEYGKN